MTLILLIARKVLLIVFTTLLVSTCTFLAVHFLSEDLALQIAAARFSGAQPSQALADVVIQTYGLDRPVLVQYFEWLYKTLQLDFGTSLVTARDVAHDIQHYAFYSLQIVCWGFLAGIGLAIPIGYICGRFEGKMIDNALSTFSATASTLPTFLVAIIIVQFLVVELKLGTLSGSSGWDRLWVIILTVALAISGSLSRVVRAAVIDVRSQPYIQHALMRGVPERQVFLRHGVKNALKPILSYLPIVFMFLIYDVIVIETVFNYHGLGWALINAVQALDIPVMQGLVLTMVAFYFVSITVCEVVSELIYNSRANPRALR